MYKQKRNSPMRSRQLKHGNLLLKQMGYQKSKYERKQKSKINDLRSFRKHVSHTKTGFGSRMRSLKSKYANKQKKRKSAYERHNFKRKNRGNELKKILRENRKKSEYEQRRDDEKKQIPLRVVSNVSGTLAKYFR
jgi:hypothetical protein